MTNIMCGRNSAAVHTDNPTNEDWLGLENYVSKLSKYIMQCQTPMTMSLQGGWGTGKTSLFQLMKKKLSEFEHSNECVLNQKVSIIEINTWKYSVAGYQDNLLMIIMLEICEKLHIGKAQKEIVQTLKKGAATVVGAAASFFVSDYVAEKIDGAAHLGEKEEEEIINRYKMVERLRDNFQTMIKTKYDGEDNRLIIFIDDLDRLEPIKAVELLEGIKNFIDCEGCVFILAIDEEVVYEGIKTKFGDRLGEERKKRFFDKIIQVPFDLPIASYKIDKFIAKFLGISADNNAIERYVSVVDNIVCENNPRSIKRLLNLLLLQESFLSEDEINDENRYILFALVAFHEYYKREYDELIEISTKNGNRSADLKPELKSKFNYDESPQNNSFRKFEEALGEGFINSEVEFEAFSNVLAAISALSPKAAEKPIQSENAFFERICGIFTELCTNVEVQKGAGFAEWYKISDNVRSEKHIAQARTGEKGVTFSVYFANESEEEINPATDVLINGEQVFSPNPADGMIKMLLKSSTTSTWFTLIIEPERQNNDTLKILRSVIETYKNRW